MNDKGEKVFYPGERLEKCEIIRPLGKGGQALVFLGFEPDTDRYVAIKALSPELAKDPECKSQFRKEIKRLAKLKDNKIVSILYSGQHKGIPFYAMDFLPNGDLKGRIARGMEPGEALYILREMALALDYAHRKGEVHCDVKPENILFNEDGHPVLTDLGIAKAIGHASSVQGGEFVVGTPHYMSPEQCQARPLDGRSDLYSLGIVFYEMLTRKVPYEGNTSEEICSKQVNDPPPVLIGDFALLQPILNKLTAKNPNQRYTTGLELAVDIEKMIKQGRKISLASVLKAIRAWTKENGSAIAISGGVLLAAALTFVMVSNVGGPPVIVGDGGGAGVDTIESSIKSPSIQNPSSKTEYKSPWNIEDENDSGRGKNLAGLKVVSVPSGGEVYLDGDFIGTTPFERYDLTPGPRKELRIELPGYEAKTETVSLKSGPAEERSYNLSPLPPAEKYGFLILNLDPPGASVQVMETGESYKPHMKLAPDKYTIRVEYRDHYSKNVNVRVYDGKTSYKSVKLPRIVRPGRLVVRTSTGSKIEFADGSRSYIPEMELEPGEYRLHISKPGYRPQELTATIVEGMKYDQTVILVPMVGSLTVRVAQNADVYLNGDLKGTAPLSINGLKAKEHLVEVRKKGFRSERQFVNIRDGKNSILDFGKLSEKVGDLVVRGRPDGAVVRVAGREQKGFPARFMNLPARQHTVTVSMAGYGKVSKTVEIQDQKTDEVYLEAPRLTGSLRIRGDPAGAEVSLNSRVIGYLPLTTLDRVPTGSYTVRIDKNGFRSQKESITIGDGRETKLIVVLESVKGDLLVETEPEGAQLFLDGELWSRSPMSRPLLVDAGRHKLETRLESYQASVKWVNVTGDTLNPIRIKLNPLPGRLFIKSTPAGAAVEIDGNKKGNTPLEIQLAPGQHVVGLNMDWRKPVTHKIFIEAASNQNIDILLPVAETVKNRFGMEFNLVKPGQFMMGASAHVNKSMEKVDRDEIPRHLVTIGHRFFMQTTEVTQKQWHKIMGKPKGHFSDCGGNCPVENVSWLEANGFIKKLNELEGSAMYRLPTEAEWEFACRAGSDTDYSFGNEITEEEANYNISMNSQSPEEILGPVPVKTYPPNQWGFFDMHGNVGEWCHDVFSAYSDKPLSDPRGPDKGDYRVIRGGAWDLPAWNLRSSCRQQASPNDKFKSVGFRVVRDY